MENKNRELPKSTEDLMKIYSKYERENVTEELTADFRQYKTFKEDPITPFHKDYYFTKYKTKHYRISYLILLFCILFYILYFLGFIIEAYILEIGIENELYRRLIVFIFPNMYVIIFITIFAKGLNKWNWVTYAVGSAIFIAVLFTALIISTLARGEKETIFNIIYTISGLSWAPACLTFYVTYKYHKYITEYGGVHLFLGWIYRISETHGDLKSIHISFTKLITELDSWLNHTLNLTIKNKTDIIESFSLNLISNENFLDNISKIYKNEFERALSGLLGDEILHSVPSFEINIEQRKISHLNRSNLNYLSYRLALNQLPPIISIINNLTNKKLELLYYSTAKKLLKYRSNIISFGIFVVGTIVPLIVPLFG
ncbi:MAG: hypothetical protein ACFE9Z_16860 [Promethearchaeota archaeon]